MSAPDAFNGNSLLRRLRPAMGVRKLVAALEASAQASLGVNMLITHACYQPAGSREY